MYFSLKHLLFIAILIALILGCTNDEPFEENIELKSKLQGVWMWEESVTRTEQNIFRKIELTFDNSTMYWKDSTITYTDIENIDGNMSLGWGYTNVYYSYNNGESPISYGSALTDIFEQRPVNDILWIDIGNCSLKMYTVEDGIFTLVSSSNESAVAGHPVHSSSIIFSSNDNEAVFCDASMWGISICTAFEKISK